MFLQGAAQKHKGVSGLIEIENPNRVQHKSKKADNIEVESTAPTQLSRRERYIITCCFIFVFSLMPVVIDGQTIPHFAVNTKL